MFAIAAAAFMAGLCIDAPVSHAAYGDAAWCFIKTGGDDAYQDCQYRSFEECRQAAGVGRGFCNVNPSAAPSTPATAGRPQHRAQRRP
jgi:hypothetical protein